MKSLIPIAILIFATACNVPIQQPEATPSASALPPATSTATAAPTFTPSPTLTPQPTPVPMFFTDEFNSDLGAWNFFHTGGTEAGQMTLTNDGLVMTMSAPNTWQYAIHNVHEYDGVFVSAKFSGSPSGAIGVVCSYSESTGWYEFNITHEGSYNVLLGKWLAAGVAEYRPVMNATTEYIQPGNLAYEIGMTCSNNTLLLHVNGKMFRKIDVTHLGLTPGKVGLSAAAFDNVPMNAAFEWFKVGAPE